MHDYMIDYFKPLYGKKDSNSQELFNTAINYVLSGGDLDISANMLFCHKNTVRYRVSKLQELLSPGKKHKGFLC